MSNGGGEIVLVLSQIEWVNNIPSPLTGEGQSLPPKYLSGGGGDSMGNRITILGKGLQMRNNCSGVT